MWFLKTGLPSNRIMPPTSLEIAQVWKPWMQESIEAFGASRSIFESNFPVQKLLVSYQVTWNVFERIAKAATPDEKRWLFHAAAATAYRL